MEYENLESKWWYRLLKVIYIVSYVLTALFVAFAATIFIPHEKTDYFTGRTYIAGSWEEVLIIFAVGLIATIITFEIVKGIFFYVVIGKWRAFKFWLKK